MKRLFIALALTALVLGASFWEVRYVGRQADRYTGQIEAIDDLLKENKTEAALALCRETEQNWEREVGKIYALLSHDYADAIGGAISKMRAHLEHNNSGMYFAESTSAKKGLASIKGSEYPLFENIL